MDYDMQDSEVVIDFGRLFKVIKRRWRFIVIFALIGAIIASLPLFLGLFGGPIKEVFGVSLENGEGFVPFYESATIMEVNLLEENGDQVQAMAELVKSDFVLKKAVEVNKLDKVKNTPEYLRGFVSVSTAFRNTTATLEIKVLYDDAQTSKILADSIRDQAKTFINNTMEVESFNVLQQANLPNVPVYLEELEDTGDTNNEDENATDSRSFASLLKSLVKRAILGAILGVFLSLFIIFVQFVLNDRIQTRDDVEKYLDKRVLASIPKYREGKSSRS